MDKTIKYIVRFLLGAEDNKTSDIDKLVGYTDDEQEFTNYKVVVYPSSFFEEGVYGTKASRPRKPFDYIDTTPILFGSKKIEKHKDTLVVYADIIAASYYYLSRYEEATRIKKRDKHGRFPAKKSVAYKAGFLNRPVVDEYGRLLRTWLREVGVAINEPAEEIQKIYLTHDVLNPFFNRSWKSMMREISQGRFFMQAIKERMKPLAQDKYYTFPDIFAMNQNLKVSLGNDMVDTVLFLKSGGTHKKDKPFYTLKGKDMRTLFALCHEYNVQIGLLASYEAGYDPTIVQAEKMHLEDALGKPVTLSRNRLLTSRDPEDYHHLIEAGIKEDFTMGYFDVSGFKLGTSRAVHWINPANQQVTPLLLHPVTIRDNSLSSKKHMGLDYEDAKRYAYSLIDSVKMNRGEAVLQWDTTAFSTLNETYEKELYLDILKKLDSQ